MRPRFIDRGQVRGQSLIVRVTPEEKKSFTDICNEVGKNTSHVLREFVTSFKNDNSQE